MNAPAGWYPDPGDAHITRYWDGERYTRELRWDGTAWVDPAASPPPPPVETPTPVTPTPVPIAAPPIEPAPVFAPTPATAGVPLAPPGAPRANPTPTFWIFMAASVGVALSAVLPWVSVSGFGASISSQPGTGGPGVLILFAVGVAAIAWPTVSSPALSKARKIGLIPIVVFLAIAVVTNWSDLADLKDRYNGASGLGLSIDAGVGFYLYTVSVIALVVALVRVWMAGARVKARA